MEIKSEKHTWTADEIHSFKAFLSEKITKSESYIKKYKMLLYISIVIGVCILFFSWFSWMSMTISSVFFITAFIFWRLIDKHKTSIIFDKVGLNMPCNTY
jgi:ABC-type transport system involved in cytochrome bd biosynthesis fused ATPase/permease subunit